MHTLFKYIEHLNTDQGACVAKFFHHQQELEDKQEKGEIGPDVNLKSILYSQGKRIEQDFQLQYEQIEQIADWPNRFQNLKQAKLDEIVTNFQKQNTRKTFIYQISRKPDMKVERQSTDMGGFMTPAEFEVGDQIVGLQLQEMVRQESRNDLYTPRRMEKQPARSMAPSHDRPKYRFESARQLDMSGSALIPRPMLSQLNAKEEEEKKEAAN